MTKEEKKLRKTLNTFLEIVGCMMEAKIVECSKYTHGNKQLKDEAVKTFKSGKKKIIDFLIEVIKDHNLPFESSELVDELDGFNFLQIDDSED